MRTREEILNPAQLSQWVIDNRYPKPGTERMTDTEMYHLLKEKIENSLHEAQEGVKPKWISVEDEMPKDETEVLCTNKGYYKFIGMRSILGHFVFENMEREVTHWMPIIELPNQ